MRNGLLLLVFTVVLPQIIYKCNCYKVLGLFPLPIKSHHIFFEKFMKELANRGHEVHVVSHFPQDDPVPNYHDINITGSLPSSVSKISLHSIINRGILGKVRYIVRTCGSEICEYLFKHPSILSLKNSNIKFDLVIAEVYGTDCLLYFAHHFGVPIIGISGTDLLPWAGERMGYQLDEMESNSQIDVPFADIRIYLSQFQGGEVILSKNDITGIATLCFKHPQKKNAISGTMMVDLRDHIMNLENWLDGKAVILYGEGNFCSGGDLDVAMKSGNLQGAEYISKWMQDTLMRLHCLPLISVCLLSGPSLGGGAEISVFCDYLIASSDVSYGFVHGILDIVPAYGGGSRLIQRLGYQKGLDLLLTSKILNAEECLNIGLVELIVPKESAFKDATEWTLQRVKHYHTVTRAIKQIANKASTTTLEESLKFERNIFCPFWGCERNKIALKKRIKHL